VYKFGPIDQQAKLARERDRRPAVWFREQDVNGDSSRLRHCNGFDKPCDGFARPRPCSEHLD
jgi:hypothetical protein